MDQKFALEKIIRTLENSTYSFMVRSIATHRNLVTVHSSHQPSGFNCVIDIDDRSQVQVSFLIRYPSKLSIESSPDILLYISKANVYRNSHPGNWSFDIEEGELIYYYQWFCDPTGNNFETIFSDLLLRCILSFECAHESIQELIEGKINAEQAVGEFIKRTTAYFN